MAPVLCWKWQMLPRCNGAVPPQEKQETNVNRIVHAAYGQNTDFRAGAERRHSGGLAGRALAEGTALRAQPEGRLAAEEAAKRVGLDHDERGREERHEGDIPTTEAAPSKHHLSG